MWVIGLIVGLSVAVLFLGVTVCIYMSKKKSTKSQTRYGDEPQRNEPPNVYVMPVRGEGASGRHGYHGGPPPYRYREDSWRDSKMY